ncbi:hypothetical protein ACQP00_13545 [Dactylosporangium sp. CS-047395]|uniref:hypothetical protein n=1 Tax=Dactylosporangium sp. CS-047395 TaxID=3239936 RepID=UPI003D8D5A8A
MPPVKILLIRWGLNSTYATKRATSAEIEEVLLSRPTIRRNLRGRTSTHVAYGKTRAGRRLAVAFIYDAELHSARPITAWEKR